jgi:hypothetical protein
MGLGHPPPQGIASDKPKKYNDVGIDCLTGIVLAIPGLLTQGGKL